MKILPLIITLLLLTSTVHAQNIQVSGKVTDALTGEDLIYATIKVKGSNKYTNSNEYGFYSISVPMDSVTLIYQFVGTQDQLISFKSNKDTVINVELGVDELDAVIIEGEGQNENIQNTEMGTVDINVRDIETIPVLLGEKDIVKTLQLTPGISSAGDGNAGFFVRGGNLDQNLILLDEAPVYNASHLLGFFSVFNSDALKNVKLYKSGIPAEYGGRASSVMNINMNNGNNKKISGRGGIGVISSRLTLEGPFQKNKSSWLISGRRTYADLFLKLSNNEDQRNTQLYFYDLNAKMNFELGSKDRLFLSGYFGRDNLGFQNRFGLDWGNATGTLRWNHVINPKVFSNTSFVFSDYNYGFNLNIGEINFDIKSGIQDYNLKQDFSWYYSDKIKFKMGANLIYHIFKPGSLDASGSTQINDINLAEKQALEGALYWSADHKISKLINFTYGLRYSVFSRMGSDVIYDFAPGTEVVVDSTVYGSGQLFSFYNGLEPRFASTFILSEVNSIKASYMRTNQYMSLLSNSTAGSPTDYWFPAGPQIKPQIADQVAVGYFHNFLKGKLETSFEIYYKYLQNQLDYRNGANIFLNEYVEAQILNGLGHAYGAELYVKYSSPKFSGWVSYTLSQSIRKFDEINNGKYFQARQSRIHDISVVGMWNINKRLALSGSWVYLTGDAVTYPSGKYQIDGADVFLYTERNGYRMPDYHRFDLGLTIKGKEDKKFKSSWNFSVYNMYARYNPFSIEFRERENEPGVYDAYLIALFRIVPSITWNFEF